MHQISNLKLLKPLISGLKWSKIAGESASCLNLVAKSDVKSQKSVKSVAKICIRNNWKRSIRSTVNMMAQRGGFLSRRLFNWINIARDPAE